MRYLVETKTVKGEKELLAALQKIGAQNIETVDKYDPIARIQTDVDRLGRALREVQKSAGNWEVMEYYLRGRGISQTHINAVLGGVKNFFKAVGLPVEVKKS